MRASGIGFRVWGGGGGGGGGGGAGRGGGRVFRWGSELAVERAFFGLFTYGFTGQPTMPASDMELSLLSCRG